MKFKKIQFYLLLHGHFFFTQHPCVTHFNFSSMISFACSESFLQSCKSIFSLLFLVLLSWHLVCHCLNHTDYNSLLDFVIKAAFLKALQLKWSVARMLHAYSTLCYQICLYAICFCSCHVSLKLMSIMKQMLMSKLKVTWAIILVFPSAAPPILFCTLPLASI